MNDIFNFSPLLFFAKNLMQRTQEAPYHFGYGFDTSKGFQKSMANFVQQQFNRPIGDFIRFPYQLPSLGVPTEAIVNAQYYKNNKFDSGILRIFYSKQPMSVKDAFNYGKLKVNLDANAGNKVVQLARDALLFAAQDKSLVGADSSTTAMNSDQIIDGKQEYINSVYNIPSDPQGYIDIASQYKNDLSRVLPFAQQDNMYTLLNFAKGWSSSGEKRDIMYENILRQPLWQTTADLSVTPPEQANRKQLLFDQIARQIRLGQQLPVRKQYTLENDFYDRPLTVYPATIYELRKQALSRFS